MDEMSIVVLFLFVVFLVAYWQYALIAIGVFVVLKFVVEPARDRRDGK